MTFFQKGHISIDHFHALEIFPWPVHPSSNPSAPRHLNSIRNQKWLRSSRDHLSARD